MDTIFIRTNSILSIMKRKFFIPILLFALGFILLIKGGDWFVDGAVGMVQMALDSLSENKIVDLDDERKAAMVSNLLVVLCGNHDAQPVVNSGSLY